MKIRIPGKKLFIKNYKQRLLICILIPVTITLTLFTLLCAFLLNSMQKQLLFQCEQAHKSFYNNCMLDFQNLYQSSRMLADDQLFLDVYFSTSTSLQPADFYQYAEIVKLLSTFTANKPYILQVGFVNEYIDRFISSNSTLPLKYYWDDPSQGNIVNKKNYMGDYEKRDGIFQFQALDRRFNQDVIPMLQYQIGEYNLSSPLIYYLSKSYFSSTFNNFKLTSDTSLYLFSLDNQQFIGSSDSSMEHSVYEWLLKDSYSDNGNDKVIKLDGIPYYFFVTASKSNYTDPLLFISLIPRSDIFKQANFPWQLALLALILSGILTTLLSFIMSFHLYSPIKGLLELMQFHDSSLKGMELSKSGGDELNYLENHINNLINRYSDLQTDMSNVLPTVYSRYFLNIFYQKNYENKSLEPILQNYNFHFLYEYFSCSILVSSFFPVFEQDFNEHQQHLIAGNLTKILEISQDEKCVKYVFQLAENRYCIICNAPYENHTGLLTKDFDFLQNLFAQDMDYIKFYLGCGSTCRTIQNLTESWKHANIASSQLSTFGKQNICFYQKPLLEKKAFLMKQAEENHLSTYLLQGKKKEVFSLMEWIISQNKNVSISEDAFKDLYIHLYEIGETILRRTENSGYRLMGEEYINLSAYIHNLSNLERSQYINKLYEMLCQKQTGEIPTSFNLEKIKEYIDAHYHEDIYLESLAETFGTSPKYMSRILKQALGVPFKQYLTALRIAKAKDMLTHTNEKIDVIALKCGFNNSNSFIRTFKQMTASTPGQFRSLSHNVGET